MRAPTATEWWYISVTTVIFLSAVALSVGMNIIADPSNNGHQLGWFYFWAGLGLISAVVALGIYLLKRTPNHEITWSRNGISILSVYATAIAFNFPATWKTGWDAVPLWSTLIGWIFIVLSLATLVPIWKGETKAEATVKRLRLEKLEADNAAKNRRATVGEGDLLSNGRKGKGGKR